MILQVVNFIYWMLTSIFTMMRNTNIIELNGKYYSVMDLAVTLTVAFMLSEFIAQITGIPSVSKSFGRYTKARTAYQERKNKEE